MAAPDAKLEMLRNVSLFGAMSAKELAAVEQLADTVDVPANHVLMRQDSSAGEAFVIASGGVRIERNGQEVARLGPGDVVGEMALLSEGPRNATATTTEPSTLFVLAHREFHSLMDQSAEVRRCVFDAVAKRIQRLEEMNAS